MRISIRTSKSLVAMTNKFVSPWVVVISLLRSSRLLSVANQSSLPYSESYLRPPTTTKYGSDSESSSTCDHTADDATAHRTFSILTIRRRYSFFPVSSCRDLADFAALLQDGSPGYNDVQPIGTCCRCECHRNDCTLCPDGQDARKHRVQRFNTL